MLLGIMKRLKQILNPELLMLVLNFLTAGHGAENVDEINHSQPGCTSTIPESERIDCAADASPATEGLCRSRNCRWCPSTAPTIPFCFYDNSTAAAHIDFLQRQCPSCSYCPYAKDCHPEPGANASACAARGCLWCKSSCGPSCVFSKSAHLTMTRLRCLSCTNCTQRVDCHPQTGVDRGKCLSRGCMWCPVIGKPAEPPCIFGNVKNLAAEARSKCNSCNNCHVRVDCHPEPGPTSDKCLSRNCIWCPTTVPGQPYCLYGGITSLTQNYCRSCSSCNTKIQCMHDVKNPSQLQCEVYGCMWCPLKSFGKTRCVQYLL